MIDNRKNDELISKVVKKIRDIEEDFVKSSNQYTKAQIRKRIELIIEEEVSDYEI